MSNSSFLFSNNTQPHEANVYVQITVQYHETQRANMERTFWVNVDELSALQ